jgi:hypothetical protein
MHKCQGWIYEKGRQGTRLRGRACGQKAILKIPEGMDLKPSWVCAYHAPVKLLPNLKKETTA